MGDATPPAWVGLAFPVFFIGVWLVVLNILSSMGGWRELALSYGASGRAEGQSFSFRSARLGVVNYSSCLRFVAGPTGLSVSVLFPFRPGHRALFIPWADVSAETHRGWVFHYVDLRFSKPGHIRMQLSRRLAEKLAAAGGNAVRIPEPV
jgi:hypothetical protein